MKIVITSDSHHQHYSNLLTNNLPDGDLFLYCGDWSSGYGSEEEVDDFCEWLKKYCSKFKYRIVVPGNHDKFAAKHPKKTKEKFEKANTIFLINEGIDIDGWKIWGSPHTPNFLNWHFMLYTDEQKEINWSKIPSDTDILICHGPPLFLLDKVGNEHVGCHILKKYVDIIKPKLMVYGHIHGSYGKVDYYGETIFINASLCDEDYNPVNPPMVVELNKNL